MKTYGERVEDFQATAHRMLDPERARLTAIALDCLEDLVWRWDCRDGAAALLSGERFLEQWVEEAGATWIFADGVTRSFRVVHERMHDDDQLVYSQAFRRLLKGESKRLSFCFRVNFASADSPPLWRWLRTRAVVAERDASGRAQIVVGCSADVTDEVEQSEQLAEAQRALQADRELLACTIESMPMPVYIRGKNGCNRYVNQRYADFLGLPTEAVRGRTVFDYLPPAEAAWVADDDRKLLSKHVTQTVRDVVRSHEGRQCRGRLIRNAVENQAGEVEAIVGVLIDQTDVLNAQEALARERDQLRRFVETIAIPAYLKDAQARFTIVNAATCEFFGVEAARLLGTRPIDWVQSDLGSVIEAENRDLVEQGVSFVRERVVTLPDGRTRSVIFHKRPIMDGQRNVIGIAGCIVDETDRVAARKELERALASEQAARLEAEAADRAKSRFLANVSHEIRTPITGVLGLIGMTLEGRLEPEQRELLEVAKSSAEALTSIINDILDIARIESGKLKLEALPFDPMAEVKSVSRLLEPMAVGKGLVLTVEGTGSLPEPWIGDRGRFRQILTNLMGNAIKFTAQGSVRIRLEAGADRLFLRVRDTGIGMSTEQLGRVFRPFEQADTSTTRLYGGTGLGLTISRELARQAGGEIHVTSVQGVGTEFTVELPWLKDLSQQGPTLKSPTQEGPTLESPSNAGSKQESLEGQRGVAAAIPAAFMAGTRAQPPVPPGGTGLPDGDRSATLSILIAEDNPVNQRILNHILTGSGHRVTLVEHGAAAVEAFAAQHFDLVLMDIQMPVMDGREATRRIREIESTRQTRPPDRVPIVAVTAHVFPGEQEQCFNAGMDEVLGKPIDKLVLMALCRKTAASLAARLGRDGH